MKSFVKMESRAGRLGFGVSLVALAAGAATPAAMAQEEELFALEEIVVTAQKRAESLQDVPVSISAAMGDKIEKAGIADFQDLSETMPGVHISRAVNHSPISIRGISSGVNRAFDQSVGLFVDGIGMSRGRQYRMPFLDIERIEVLRGPQGSLFGKNTIAGALNVTTVSPRAGDEFNGYVAAKYEPDTQSVDVSGAATLPLGDTAALRIAARYADADGFITNIPTDTDAIQPEDMTVRGTFVWEPNDNLDVNLKYTHSSFDTTGSPIVPSTFTLIDDPKAPLDALAFAAVGFVAPGMITDTDKTHSYVSGYTDLGRAGPEGSTTTLDDIAATIKYALANEGEITSVTGYSTYDAEDNQDVDFLPIRLLAQYDGEKYDQFSQEIRYASPVGETFEYLIGGYYETADLANVGQVAIDSSIGGFTNLAIGLPSVFAALAGPAYALYPVVEAARNRTYDLGTESWAAFGQASWHMSDRLKLTVGGRYTHSKRDVVKDVYLSGDIGGGADLLTPVAHPILNAVFAGAFGTVAHHLESVRTENHFDPTATVSWDVSDDVMAFARFAKGHKMGGFNASDDQAFNPVTGDPVGFEFEDEKAKTYEAGVKATLMGGRGRLNATAFQTDYSNLQVTSFQGTTFSVSNAANSRIRGLEADFEFRATEALTLRANGAWLDFQFKDFTTAGCTAAQIAATAPGVVCQQDLSGRTNAFAPKLSGVIAAEYTKDITEGLNLSVDADVNYRGASYLVDDLDEAGKQDAYAKINARIAIASVDDTWSLAVYGRNLTDKITFSYIVDTPLVTGAQSGVVNQGRVIGIEGRFRF